MKKLLAIVSAALLLGASGVSAQDLSGMFHRDNVGKISYGVRAGLNLSNIYGRTTVSEGLGLGTQAGWQVGANVDIPIFNGFSVQPGLFFTTRGAHSVYKEKYVVNNATYTDVYKATINPVYMEIPVLASFHFVINNDFSLQLNSGPYFAIGLGGNSKWSFKDGEEGTKTDAKTPYFGKSSLGNPRFGAGRFDFGWCFGAGVTFREHYFVGIQYDWGWVNFAIKDDVWAFKKDSKASLRNGNWAIQLGYNF